MHMLPGTHALLNIADEGGNVLDTTTWRTDLTNRVWNFDLVSQKRDLGFCGKKDRPQAAAVAIDTKQQVGWYYRGQVSPDVCYVGTELVYLNGPTIGLISS